jgi:N-acetylglucosaminyl-diphospho-decaprenol L-rhamnosyltransferase
VHEAAVSRTAAVIVTWNAAEMIGDCLRSLPATVDVVVVDNASADGTREVLRGEFPAVRLVENESNTGFAAAANRGLADVSGADYALLLNPDALLEPGALEVLVDFLDAHPRAASCSALVIDAGGRPEPGSAGPEPTLLTAALHELGLAPLSQRLSTMRASSNAGPARRDWVAGTSVLLRTEALRDVGPFDESFFLYCEDIDWCRRARDAGWEVWLAPMAKAVHAGSASVRTAGAWVDEYRIGSLDRYFALHHSRTSVWCFRVLRVIGKGVRAIGFGIAGRVLRRPEWVARGAQRRHDAKLAAALLRRR